MRQELFVIVAMYHCMVGKVKTAFKEENGGVAEKVVIVAIFVALAIAAGTIITQKVVDKANSINLG